MNFQVPKTEVRTRRIGVAKRWHEEKFREKYPGGNERAFAPAPFSIATTDHLKIGWEFLTATDFPSKSRQRFSLKGESTVRKVGESRSMTSGQGLNIHSHFVARIIVIIISPD